MRLSTHKAEANIGNIFLIPKACFTIFFIDLFGGLGTSYGVFEIMLYKCHHFGENSEHSESILSFRLTFSQSRLGCSSVFYRKSARRFRFFAVLSEISGRHSDFCALQGCQPLLQLLEVSHHSRKFQTGLERKQITKKNHYSLSSDSETLARCFPKPCSCNERQRRIREKWELLLLHCG